MKDNKKYGLTKKLLILLGILVVIAIGIYVWGASTGKNIFNPSFETLRNNNPVTVASLKDGSEKDIGTIIYSAAKVVLEPVKSNTYTTLTLQSPDSMKGVVNIYSQDLTNRYPNYSTTKETIKNAEALNSEATLLKCRGNSGDLSITIWANNSGMTSIEIKKDAGF